MKPPAPVLHVGCPMWAQRAWVSRYFPADTPAGQELRPYSRYLNAVEGNTTFYALPPAETVAKWVALAHSGFRFVFKVPRSITHDRRLHDVDEELDAFVALMEPLGEHVGAFTFQLPPSFGPRDLAALARVLQRVSTAWRWSVEVRHPDFYGGAGRRALEALLRRHDAEWVLLDTTALFHRTPISPEGLDEWRTKPRLPLMDEPLTDRPIVRFIGSDHPELTDAGLRRWEPIVTEWLDQGRTPTIFVHTPDNGRSPRLARGFHDAVRQEVPGLTPLLEPLPVAVAEQISLF